MCIALTWLDPDTAKRILKKTHHMKLDRNTWMMEHGGVSYKIRFSKDNVIVIPECEYIARGGYRRFATMPTPRISETKRYGTGKYKYSLCDLDCMFPYEQFYLNHLTPALLTAYADTVASEMEEWDGWLAHEDISQYKRDKHLASIEEQTLHKFAPYMDELESLDDILKLFEK